MSHLANLINGDAPAKTIGDHLVSLSVDDRTDEVRSLSRKAVGDLYRKMTGQRPMTLDDFVPPSLPSDARIPPRNQYTSCFPDLRHVLHPGHKPGG